MLEALLNLGVSGVLEFDQALDKDNSKRDVSEAFEIDRGCARIRTERSDAKNQELCFVCRLAYAKDTHI